MKGIRKQRWVYVDLVANINVRLEDLSWYHRIEFANHKENECKCDAMDIRVVSIRRTLGYQRGGASGWL